jgi:hypothetical protein
MPAYRPLDRTLTLPLDEPAPPVQRCTDNGQPAWCALDLIGWIEAWRGVLRQANVDRAAATAISAPLAPAVP